MKDNIGFSNKHKFELTAKKALFNNSSKRIILADPTKFLVEQDEVFAPFNENMIVITSGNDEYPEAISKFEKVVEDNEKNVKLIII